MSRPVSGPGSYNRYIDRVFQYSLGTRKSSSALRALEQLSRLGAVRPNNLSQRGSGLSLSGETLLRPISSGSTLTRHDSAADARDFSELRRARRCSRAAACVLLTALTAVASCRYCITRLEQVQPGSTGSKSPSLDRRDRRPAQLGVRQQRNQRGGRRSHGDRVRAPTVLKEVRIAEHGTAGPTSTPAGPSTRPLRHTTPSSSSTRTSASSSGRTALVK